MTAIALVVAAILVGGGVLVLVYRVISRLPHDREDKEDKNGDRDTG